MKVHLPARYKDFCNPLSTLLKRSKRDSYNHCFDIRTTSKILERCKISNKS